MTDAHAGRATESLARTLADFVVASRGMPFPPEARTVAADAIVDGCGCMIAGTREPIAAIVRKVLPRVARRSGGAPLLGSAETTAPADAALYHGALAHALDYDDTNHPAYAHPTAVIVPAALAAAALADATGHDLVTAHIVGVEVFGKLGRALNTGHYKRGWHATSTFGAIAAAVVAGAILRLSASELTTAIGIAASAAGGLRVNFGTMMKPLHAGYAARNGVLAAQLARAGVTASDASLEHRYGYAHVLAGESAPALEWLASWGEPLEILTDYGLALKPFPACGATHPAIEAAMLLHHDIGGRTIAEVRVGVSSMAFEPLIYVAPTSPLEGKFSMHYCVAAALVDGNVELATFSDANIANPEIGSLIPKIRMEMEPHFADDTEFPAIVCVTLGDGTVLERAVPLAMGKRARWPLRAALMRKYSDCALASLGPDRVRSTFERLSAIDSSMSLADLIDTLQPNAMLTT